MNTSELPEYLGKILIAHSDLDIEGLVRDEEGNLFPAISLMCDISQGQRVIVERIVDDVGLIVERYLDESEWEEVDVI